MAKLQLERDAAPGIHRVEDAHTNWFIVEDEARITLVDTGFPRSWNSLHAALRQLGRSPGDIEAIVLTHAHFDHMGFARRAQQELGVPLWAHREETSVVAHPWRYQHEHSRLPYFRHPEFVQIFTEMSLMGALLVRGSDRVRTYSEGERLDVPGRPQVLFTPGHSLGHCSLLFDDRQAVIVGDAFVTLDPYTGRRGPCIVAGAATADSQRAFGSLDVLAGLEVTAALTGHGPVWRGPIDDAVTQAKAAGPA